MTPPKKASSVDPVLLLLILSSLLALLYRLDSPQDALIFDETYYVQDARVILGLPVLPFGLPPEQLRSGCDPNAEHPPLAKLLIAGSMAAFRAWGFAGGGFEWRFPSVLFGLTGVFLVYGVVRVLDGTRGQARMAAFLLAFDNLYFVHSRIATLDIYLVTLSSLGVFLYLSRRYELAGIALALATLCKISGLFTVFALFFYECGRWWQHRRLSREPEGGGANAFVLMYFFYVLFGASALGALDCYFTRFTNPVSHVRHILSFGASLSRPKTLDPQGAESTPLQWWRNHKQFDYLSVTTSHDQFSNTEVRFQCALSLYLIAAAPFALYFCWLQALRGDRVGLLVVCWVFASYVPLLATWLISGRICYLYYMLPSMPGLAIGTARLIAQFPAWVTGLLTLATLYVFVSLFPFSL